MRARLGRLAVAWLAGLWLGLLAVACGGGGNGEEAGTTPSPSPSGEVESGAVVGRIEIDPTIPLVAHHGALPDLNPGESLEVALEGGDQTGELLPDDLLFFPLPEEVGLVGVLGAVIVDPGEEIGNSGPPQIGDLLTPIAITDDGTYAFTGVPATNGQEDHLLVVEFYSAVAPEEENQLSQAGPPSIRRKLIKLVFPVGIEPGKVTRLDITLRPSGPAVEVGDKRLLPSRLLVEVKQGLIDAAGREFPRPEEGGAVPGRPSRILPPDFPRDGFFAPDFPTRLVEHKVIDRQRRETFNDRNGNGVHDPNEPLYPDPNLDGHPGFLVGFPKLIGPHLMRLRVVRPSVAVDQGRLLEIRLEPGFTRLIGIRLDELKPDRLVGVLVFEHRGELVARQIYPAWGWPPPGGAPSP